MRIKVNSVEKEIAESKTVEMLLGESGYSKKGHAVAVNGKLVFAHDHASYILKEGDDVVIIGAAYGG